MIVKQKIAKKKVLNITKNKGNTLFQRNSIKVKKSP